MKHRNWVDLEPSARQKIVDAYYQDPDYIRNAAVELGITEKTLRRYVEFWNAHVKMLAVMPVQREPVLVQERIEIPRQESLARLTDITEADTNTKQLEWLTWLHDRYASTNPDITVMHFNDAHYPFHDPKAQERFVKVAKIARPDIIIRGSDENDFYNLTSFPTNPDIKDEDEEALDNFEKGTTYHSTLLKGLSEIQLYIFGNHERRLLRTLMSESHNFRKRLLREFEDILSRNGIWYLGEVDHIRMGPLQVEHGARSGNTAPKQRLMDVGHQVSIMMGHTHKEFEHVVRGVDFTVRAVSSGCLCQINPHYVMRGISAMPGMQWQQGTVVASFSLRERVVSFEKVDFSEPTVWFRGQRIS